MSRCGAPLAERTLAGGGVHRRGAWVRREWRAVMPSLGRLGRAVPRDVWVALGVVVLLRLALSALGLVLWLGWVCSPPPRPPAPRARRGGGGTRPGPRPFRGRAVGGGAAPAAGERAAR